MKRIGLILFFIFIIFSVLFGKFWFSFSFTFGSTGTSAQLNLKSLDLPEGAPKVSVYLDSYPGILKYDEYEFLIAYEGQTISLPSGEITVEVDNIYYTLYLPEKSYNVISFSEDKPLPINAHLFVPSTEISPNDDWCNDEFEAIIYVNTYSYAQINISGIVKKFRLRTGKNLISLKVDELPDGPYTVQLKIWNSIDQVNKNFEIFITRDKRCLKKPISIIFLSAFIIFFIWILVSSNK